MTYLQRFQRSIPTLLLLVLVITPQTWADTSAPTDFSGHWVVVDMTRVVLPEQDAEQYGKFTELAQERIQHYNAHYDPIEDDPANVCLWKGMPWTMLIRARDYPMEVYQSDDRIVLNYELYDMSRNLLIDGSAMPRQRPPSGNGYSTATWEGKTLVVETRGLTATHPISPYHRSEDAVITERWNLVKDDEAGDVITIDITVDDPEIYSTPAKAHQELKRAGPGTVVGGYNCTEALWANYIETRREALESQGQ